MVSIVAGSATGQVLRYNTGTSAWERTKLLYTDLVNASSASPWPATCGAGQGLTYSTVSDAFTCVTLTGYNTQNITNLGNTLSGDITMGTNDAYAVKFETGDTVKVTITSGGSVGIGTTTPRSALDVSAGTITGKTSVANTTGPVDFSLGNIQHTTNSCAAYALHNLKDGGTYTFIVKGTAVATCSFTAFSDAGVTGLTVHLPPGHGVTTTLKHTLYSVLVSGSDVYLSWVPGY